MLYLWFRFTVVFSFVLTHFTVLTVFFAVKQIASFGRCYCIPWSFPTGPYKSKLSMYSIHDNGSNAEIIRDQTNSVENTRHNSGSKHLPITSLAIFFGQICVFSLDLKGHFLKYRTYTKNRFHITWHRRDSNSFLQQKLPSPKRMIFFQSQFLVFTLVPSEE